MMNFSSGRPIIVTGLGFGDEGKGTIVDALVRQMRSSLVIRYNGGAQAGHNVVTSKKVWHCFAQFGAGLLVPDTTSFLSEHMLIDLDSMFVERDALKQKIRTDPIFRQSVDPNCLIVTPIQRTLGRMKEVARGAARYGSCGMGIGQTMLDDKAGLSIRVCDILNEPIGKQKLVKLIDAKRIEAYELATRSISQEFFDLYDLLENRTDPDALFYATRLKLDRLRIERLSDVLQTIEQPLIFEGAQGALLDKRRGFAPHVTQSDTTSKNAIDLLVQAKRNDTPFTLGVLRAYGHRHGAGPFVTEDASVRERFQDRYNPENPWQGAFRTGWIDLPALRYAIRMNGHVDALALTGLDRLSDLKRIRICTAYRTKDGRFLTDIPDSLSATERTDLVQSCTPEWIEGPGWIEDISQIKNWNHLPVNAKSVVQFLEQPEQLGKPIAIVSVGPTADHKLFR